MIRGAAFFFLSVLSAEELARWEASNAARGNGIEVVRAPASGWTIDAGGFARLASSEDYYQRSSFRIRISKDIPGPAWLAAEYLDTGYGLIELSPPVTQSRQWGVARVNTGKVRRSVFLLDAIKPASEFRLFGLTHLRSLSLTGSEPAREPAPLVEPAVALTRPMQLVTTAGADAPRPEGLPEALAALRNQLPLVRALGFNGVESYVKWDFVERSPGVFDWSFYDAVVDEIEKHGLQWFPLLIVGSAYTLPDWYHDSAENAGFVCLEHRMRNDIQTIFSDNQVKYVRRFLGEFGKHYGGRRGLLGIRLGPSGNYGEAQYPARGDWGYRGQPIHTHIGYWAADPRASVSFRHWLRQRYATVEDLNRSWGDRFPSFDQVQTFLPVTAATRRKRIDFADWYMGAMSEWCAKWAQWAREALPHTVIHQSSGGWGPIEIGTDYTHQARTMAALKGGIRLTNEADNYADNFAITRMASSAARFYGAQLGYEPGGFGSVRGVMARLYNCLTNGGEHLFYYHPNLTANDQALQAWVKTASLLDRRAKPVVDVATFYPDTSIKLDDEVIRYRFGGIFLAIARELRSAFDHDFVSEQMIEDGALEKYKVLVFTWGHITEQKIAERIRRWVEAGGTVIYPERPRGLLETVEGDRSQSDRWRRGETGKGRVIFFSGDTIPGDQYARFVRKELLAMDGLDPQTRRGLRIAKPAGVYWSVLEGGRIALLNFSDEEAGVRFEGKALRLAPYAVVVE
ncbi:MAG: beta-galactosidase [Acidobacteria bacterium]|nr:beta-galactosidase [Acidobacteriota bacterium]